MAVTYDCSPSGALVYQQGYGELGRCPVTVKYNTDDSMVKDGMLHLNAVKAVWVSGATLILPPTSVSVENHYASFNIMRPPEFLDETRDEDYSISYTQSFPTPHDVYIVSPYQDKNVFNSFNSATTCFWYGIIQNVYAVCD